MKSITTKLIFGAALSIVGIATISPQAWAANRITPQADFEVQASQSENGAISVDHNFYKLKMNFQLPDNVKSGDYFEIETHGLPFLTTKQDILSGDDKVKIGELIEVSVTPGTRDLQIFRGGNFDSLRSEDSSKKVYKAVFSNSIESRHDVRFSIQGQSIYSHYAVSSRPYSVETWIKINGEKKASKIYSVGEWTKYKPSVYMDMFRAHLDTRQTTEDILFIAGSGMIKDQVLGADYELTIDNPYYKFASLQHAIDKNPGAGYIYDDESYVNSNGVILYDNRKSTLEISHQSEKKVSLRVMDLTHQNYGTGLAHYILNLTDEGKKYVAENGKLPKVSFNFDIVKDSKNIYSGKGEGEVVVIGESAEFLSKIKEEVKEIEKKEKTPETPKTEEAPKQEIKAPNTGFDNQRYITAIISGITAIGSLVMIFVNKK